MIHIFPWGLWAFDCTVLYTETFDPVSLMQVEYFVLLQQLFVSVPGIVSVRVVFIG